MQAVIRTGNLAVVQLLVERGADVNLMDDERNTVLFYLFRLELLEGQLILEYLIENKLNVNEKIKDDIYPHTQNNEARYEYTKILIREGIQYIPGDPQTLIMKGIYKNDCTMVEFLLKHGAETKWEVDRQGEDEWGRYSVTDNYNMLNYAKQCKATDVVQLLERHASLKT
jgi:ankyrin repeat protein